MGDLKSGLKLATGWVLHHRKNKETLFFKYNIFNILVDSKRLNQNQFQIPGHRFLRISSSDYLDGASENLDMGIRKFLSNHLNYTPDQVFLQTVPRMFGYVFNPISLWHCYQNKTLDAVLCEVNNTFGDRHFYFIRTNGETSTSVLKKKFHVSPFFPIEGMYEFTFDINDRKTSTIINYLEDSGELKLKTQLHLTLSEIDALSSAQLLRKYKWMTVMIIFRIHYHALKLWLKKVQFYRRPLPPQKEITHE